MGSYHAVRSSAWSRPVSLVVVKSEEPAAAEAKDESAPAATLTFEMLEVGEEYEGKVKGVSDFGAFVDLGVGSDGLVHKSQLSDEFVASPAEFVTVGQVVKARVLKIDVEKKQISLSMKSKDAEGSSGERKPRRSGGADMSKYEAMTPEEVLDGTVRTVTAYGAFVDFEDGATGLVHVSQMAEGRVESPADVVTVGDAVKVRIINAEDGKLSLTMKAYNPDQPDEKPRGQRRERSDDGDGMSRRERPPQIDDIWNDNTEPKWADFQTELNGAKAVRYDNVLELKL